MNYKLNMMNYKKEKEKKKQFSKLNIKKYLKLQKSQEMLLEKL